MLPAIENGFTFIAFLMFLAGGLLAMEKYTKWKVFNWVPPLVWIYILNMVFCTLGLYNSEGVSAAYGVLKNNLLYAMIFVMLLRCDFRKIAKLSGRMIAIFLGCSITLALGFIVGFPIFKGSLGGGETIWGATAALYASWVGGSANIGCYAGCSAGRCRRLRLRSYARHRLLLRMDCAAALCCEVCRQVEQVR